MKNSKVLEYRADLDGLKALAVFAAIFFHAEFEWFQGGFIGVDIFFVISGFLITSIILKDKENNKFSLYIFYLRRIRRVIPALFVVTLFSTLVGSYLMTATDFEPFSKSVISVIFFISNFFFWTESGYFGAASELKPLLHTWSLGVEEQFYIFYPLFLIFFWKFKKNYLILSIILLSILSFILAQIGGNFKYVNLSLNYPYFKLPWEWFWQAGSADYYLPFGRIWELMIGALISFYFQKNTIKDKFVNNIYSYFGLILIIFSIFTYSENLQYPSVFTLAPAIGTGLIILFATKDTHVRKILSTKLLVNLGLIAYGLYLWHLPLFVFAKIYLVSDLSFMISVILIILSMILAYLSWKYIERPFRKRDKITDMNIMSNKKLLTYFASSFLIIFFGANIFNFNKKMEVSTELPVKISQSLERFKAKDHCFDIDFAHLTDSKKWYCEIGSSNKPISFAVIGDSHALAFKPVLGVIAEEKNLKGMFTGFAGCIPFLDIYTIRGDQVETNCKKLNEKLFNFIKTNKIKKIFLVSRWSYYTDGTYDKSNFSLISKDKVFASNPQKSREAFKYGLKKTIERYNKIKVKVIFIHQVPLQLFAARNIYLNAIKKDKLNYEKYLYNFSVDYKKHLSLTEFVRNNVNLVENQSLFEEINPDKFFCDSKKCIIGSQEGSFYADSGHLSIQGSLKLKNIIEKTFD